MPTYPLESLISEYQYSRGKNKSFLFLFYLYDLHFYRLEYNNEKSQVIKSMIVPIKLKNIIVIIMILNLSTKYMHVPIHKMLKEDAFCLN